MSWDLEGWGLGEYACALEDLGVVIKPLTFARDGLTVDASAALFVLSFSRFAFLCIA
jgi:hypothetical protein